MRKINTLLISVIYMLVPAFLQAAQSLDVPGISGADNRLINETDAYPWSAVGRLNITTGGFCTAVVIGPRRILTSAHCLWNKRVGRWYPPCALHFLAGYSKGKYKVHALAAELHIAEGYKKGNKLVSERDWAIITLNKDVAKDTGVIEFYKQTPKKGLRIIQAGYSRDRRHVLTIDETCKVLNSPKAQKLMAHNCDATFGDSGSPLLVRNGNRYQTLGIHKGFSKRKQGVVGVAVSVLPAQKWLRQYPITKLPNSVKACMVEDKEIFVSLIN